MKTAVIGYPRIGENRELKFASEKFFKGEISENELNEIAKEIRVQNWFKQLTSGISFISSNDFSYYDNVLDTAVLFNIIPKRYSNLGLSEKETYFALARGYQGKKGDVKALAMKKWFNTNYHYLVPEIDDDTEVKLVGSKPFNEYLEAKKIGIETKVAIIGPFTLLKLARYTGNKKKEDFKNALVCGYTSFLEKLNELNVKWVQFDEPYLVKDIDETDKAFFVEIYKKLLNKKGNVKTLIQTYFGDVRDVYKELTSLDFDGIGLDFIEGRKTFELIECNGFPNNKLLFAGLVNGKNIWKNEYSKTIDRIKSIETRANVNAEKIVISTSCSLLHVPNSLDSEKKLSDDYKKHFAFAKEKLTELSELSILAGISGCESDARYIKNVELFRNRKNVIDEAVKKRVTAIKDEDYTRLPAFEEREAIQKEKLNLPAFPTTTIGSFPQTADVKRNRKLFKKAEISKDDYIDFNKKKIAECIALQEEIGLDVIVHGEYERNDMVEYFGEHLAGYVFTENAWVQSYGTRCVKPPIIWGDVSRKEAITVSWSKYAKSCTDKPVKGMLTGPVTILNWSFPREDISIKESTLQIALAIRDEVLDLETNGIDIIQIDEAALREKLPLRKSDWYSEYLDWAIPAFRLVHSGVKPQTQIHTHMCYSEFTDIIPAIDAMDADVITFEASRSDLLILDSLKEHNFKTEVGPGVYDIHSPRVPSTEEIVEALKKMREKIDDSKLWINPDCGLKTRGERETKESLINLVKAAKLIRTA
ncbi:MAG: 5-methyltetrahydropteroyltriglutamate--homocysteine S-methyltransferase [Lachnospiraceae bacterium]|nr:5-methyltetrahydropteroyltriglutamate--homocysteine S-methyltransferase [Lachnospiraceae bacterium]